MVSPVSTLAGVVGLREAYRRRARRQSTKESHLMIVSAAAAQLDRAAAVYENAAQTLRPAAALSDAYISHLNAASTIDWQSPAAAAYAAMLSRLRAEGGHVEDESTALVAEATLIAADLRSAADQARRLAQALEAIAGVDVTGIAGEALARRARTAIGDAVEMTSFLSDYNGIPPGLYSVVRLAGNLTSAE